MESRQRLSRGRVVSIVLLVVWFITVLWWAFQPINDSVPTGMVNNQQTAQVVHCDAPLSGNAGPTEPIPALPPGRAYERAACTLAHSQYLRLFWFDTALVAVALVLLVGVRRRREETPSAGASATSYTASVSSPVP